MINGINSTIWSKPDHFPAVDQYVQEFKADNSTFSAEYGRKLRRSEHCHDSGSNAITASCSISFATRCRRAHFFDARKPPFRRNQFGFNIGGPVMLPHFGEGGSPLGYNGKNRTFFFFSYEGTRQRQGLTLTSNVLTPAQRAAATSSTVIKLLPLIPLPTSIDNGIGRFTGSGTAPVNIDQWTGDVSHNFNAKDRLHGYYAFQRDRRGEPNLQGNTLPGFGDTRQSSDRYSR